MAADRTLTPREARFCELYVLYGNATRAAESAGYSPRRARQTGWDLLQLPHINDRLEQLRTAVSERTAIEVDDVLREFWAIHTADPAELIEYRRTCCRHCHGANHDHQRTQRELDRARKAWDEAMHYWRTARGKSRPPKPSAVFDEQGGPGWDPDREPHPDCPECHGHGIARTYVRDTRLVSPAARRLYSGVKETKDGFEVKMRDQDAALVNVGKILGAFKEVVEHHDGTLEDLIRDAAGESEATDVGDA